MLVDMVSDSLFLQVVIRVFGVLIASMQSPLVPQIQIQFDVRSVLTDPSVV